NSALASSSWANASRIAGRLLRNAGPGVLIAWPEKRAASLFRIVDFPTPSRPSIATNPAISVLLQLLGNTSHFGIFRLREAITGDYDGNGLVIAFLESIELFLLV